MNRIRLLSVLIAACAVGLVIYKPFRGGALTELHPVAHACLNAQSSETATLSCRAALASDELSDTERGVAAFRWAFMSNREDWELQLELYNEAIEFFPAKTAAFFNRGMLLSEHVKDHEAAAADFTEVIDRIAPTSGPFLNAYAYRARAYRNLEKNRRAMADVDLALSHEPNNLMALQEKAELLADQNDFKGALAVLDKAIAAHADDEQIVLLWKDRAWVKAKLGEREDALSDINNAIELGSNTAWTWYWRGRLNMEAGDVRAGISDLQTSLQLDPTYCPALRRMRDIERQLETVARERAQFHDTLADETHADDPYDTGRLLMQHLTLAQNGEYPEALDVLNQLIGSARHPEYLMLQRARLYAIIGQYDKALSELEVLVKTPEYYQQIEIRQFERGSELKLAGNACASREVRYQGLEFLSLFSDVMGEKVALQRQMNNLEGALETLDIWIEHVPEDNQQWTSRGEILDELGRTDEALANYDEALRLIGSGEGASRHDDALHIETLFLLKSIYDDRGQSDQALLIWDESLSAADNSVIWNLQEMMEIAGHYEGRWHGRYDHKTKASLRYCLADSNCNWENINPQMR